MPSKPPSLPDVPLIESDVAALESLIAEYPAHADIARSLHEKGFAVFDPGFAAEDLDAAEAFCRSKLKGKGRIQDGWISDSVIGRLAVHPPILEILSSLYGRRAFPFQTLNFEFGTQQMPHSDTYHFDSTPGRFMCGVWVALENISSDAGPLVYYPGSHRLPILKRDEIGGEKTYQDYEKQIQSLIEEHGLQPEYGLLKRGQALIWAANLIHGGSIHADSAKTRLSQVTHYYFADCAYHTPQSYDLAQGRAFVRQPFDLSKRRHVLSNRAYLNQQLSLYDILAQRWHLWRQRPARF
ncbi:MAG: phytanoyl-CoA dioxygenase family protein [Henriciella sp.]|nr:phytanoyl-CoA dioxygenase family protein [Henriciella sp.]